MTSSPFYLKRDGNPDLAWRKTGGNGPGIVWLGGYASDMLGTKAEYLDQWARENNRAYLRFDYSGHGESKGQFVDHCISDWLDDAKTMLRELTSGPQILVGSSMGGWIASLLAQSMPDQLAGIVYIAPAPDFTSELMWPSWDEATRQKLLSDGKVEFPSAYDDSVMVYTRKLYEDGADNQVFAKPLKLSVPVRILQGMQDDSVPWQHAMRLAEHIEADDLEVHLVKNADHRMSGHGELKLLGSTLAKLQV